MTCPTLPPELAKILGRIASRVQRYADAATCTRAAQQYAQEHDRQATPTGGPNAECYYSFEVPGKAYSTEMLFDGRPSEFAGQLLCYWEAQEGQQNDVLTAFEAACYDVVEEWKLDPHTNPEHEKTAERVLLQKGGSLVGVIINPPFPFHS